MVRTYVNFNKRPYFGTITDKGTFTRFESDEGLTFDIENGVLYAEMQLGNFMFFNLPNKGVFTETVNYEGVWCLIGGGVPLTENQTGGNTSTLFFFEKEGNFTLFSETVYDLAADENGGVQPIDIGDTMLTGYYYAIKCNPAALSGGILNLTAIN